MSRANKTIDWASIAEDYIAGVKGIRAIGREYDVAEGTIRAKAKRAGWIRNPKSVKAKKVKEQMGGKAKAKTVNDKMAVFHEPHQVAVSLENVDQLVEAAVNQDVKDMNLGLENARKALHKAGLMIDLLDDSEGDPRFLKTLADVTKLSVDTIRKIRGLDEVEVKPDELAEWSEDQLREELDRLTR